MRRLAWTTLAVELVALIVLGTPAAADNEPRFRHLHFNPDATLDTSQVIDLTP